MDKEFLKDAIDDLRQDLKEAEQELKKLESSSLPDNIKITGSYSGQINIAGDGAIQNNRYNGKTKRDAEEQIKKLKEKIRYYEDKLKKN